MVVSRRKASLPACFFVVVNFWTWAGRTRLYCFLKSSRLYCSMAQYFYIFNSVRCICFPWNIFELRAGSSTAPGDLCGSMWMEPTACWMQPHSWQVLGFGAELGLAREKSECGSRKTRTRICCELLFFRQKFLQKMVHSFPSSDTL